MSSPFAIDGAAPSTTTKRMADSSSPKSRMASGNQAIEGMVCSPVINEPTAVRSSLKRATSTPMTTPMTTARA